MLVQRRRHRVTINPIKPEFIIVIFIHYKPRSWLVVDEDDLKCVKN